MKKYGIFYGSSTGTCESVAKKIATALGVAPEDVHDVAKAKPSDVADYEVLVLGTSTWGSGELQDDWYDFADGLASLYLADKKIALFGCGDENMSDTFCGGVGQLYHRLKDTKATFIGAFPADVYDYSATEADVDGTIVGLLLDEVNKPELTGERIAHWAEEVKANS